MKDILNVFMCLFSGILCSLVGLWTLKTLWQEYQKDYYELRAAGRTPGLWLGVYFLAFLLLRRDRPQSKLLGPLWLLIGLGLIIYGCRMALGVS